ncbi:MAG: hypothetical protein EZS26_001021 [Candidatus Ordinivivax streblomastigis]|uniref:Uncharacterized protein n=1 Tax=Candidatus Ordinivivax streblomastigis TaxID=2540710 RepID=A0A5M8P361_9BACT|nr:MAG: hypothetical protein EZS26_001021 [Candidatus Ordinivivax streblomastigis]
MRKSKFKEPKIVLVFNGARVLIAIVRSLHSAALFSGGNLQAISFVCTGKYISTGGYYFRHVHPEIEVEVGDLDTLKLETYDEMCGTERRYHSIREMARRRNVQEKKIN